jgi:hypothetical protein
MHAQGSSSCSPDSSFVWKFMWQLKVPRTVQLFLWRGCNDILPTKEKLFKRKIIDDLLCPLCGNVTGLLCEVTWQFLEQAK